MKKAISLVLTLVLLAGFACTAFAEKRTVAPIPVPPVEDFVDDGEYPVSFKVADLEIGKTEGEMILQIYSIDHWANDEMSKLQVGDVIVIEGRSIVIKDITNEDGVICINLDSGEYLFGYDEETDTWTFSGEGDTTSTTLIYSGLASLNKNIAFDIDRKVVAKGLKEFKKAMKKDYPTEYTKDGTDAIIKNGQIVSIHHDSFF